LGEGESILVAVNTAKKIFKAKLHAVVRSSILSPRRCLWFFLFSCKEWLKPIITAAAFYWGKKPRQRKILKTALSSFKGWHEVEFLNH